MHAPEGRFPQYYPWGNSSVFFTTTGGKRYVSVSSVDMTGPFNAAGPSDTPSRDRIFVCRPESLEDEAPCATDILATLARPAPPTSSRRLRALRHRHPRDACAPCATDILATLARPAPPTSSRRLRALRHRHPRDACAPGVSAAGDE